MFLNELVLINMRITLKVQLEILCLEILFPGIEEKTAWIIQTYMGIKERGHTGEKGFI